MHPFLTEFLVGGNGKTFKKILPDTLLFDVKELGKHGHEESLAKTPRAGEQSGFARSVKEPLQESGLVT